MPRTHTFKVQRIALEIEGTDAGWMLLGGRCVVDPPAARARLQALGLLDAAREQTELGRTVREILASRDPLEIARRAGIKRYRAAVRRVERRIARIETSDDASKAREAAGRLYKRGGGYVEPATLEADERRLRLLVCEALRAADLRREAERRGEIERLEAEIAERRRNDWRRW